MLIKFNFEQCGHDRIFDEQCKEATACTHLLLHIQKCRHTKSVFAQLVLFKYIHLRGNMGYIWSMKIANLKMLGVNVMMLLSSFYYGVVAV